MDGANWEGSHCFMRNSTLNSVKLNRNKETYSNFQEKEKKLGSYQRLKRIKIFDSSFNLLKNLYNKCTHIKELKAIN